MDRQRHIGYVLIVAALLWANCGRTDGSAHIDRSCLDGIDEHRASIDADFAKDDHPLSEEHKASFDGLAYFPPNAKYCIPARFKPDESGETFDMPTRNEKSVPFRAYGVFQFEMDGVAYSLTAYQRMDLPEEKRQWAFIPFRDKTSGRETYGGGRALHFEFPINEETEIDFNRASNPWCAYNPKYICPLPPAKNWLNLSIEAGEKAFQTEDSTSS
jgi:uncharacterized protein (DUF1684 family)